MPGPAPSPVTMYKKSDKRPTAVSDGVVPKAPKWLTPAAKVIYKKTAQDMVSLGIAGRADEYTLAIFATQMVNLIELSGKTAKEPGEKEMFNKLSTQCLSLIKELGLSPMSRAKLRVAKVETDSPLDDLLKDE